MWHRYQGAEACRGEVARRPRPRRRTRAPGRRPRRHVHGRGARRARRAWTRGGSAGRCGASGPGFDGLCFSGANLVPLHGTRHALRGFADRARRHGRGCSSIVGRAELVLPLWHELSEALVAAARGPRGAAADGARRAARCRRRTRYVRPVRMDELDRYLPAAVAMFTEEVGVDPRARRRRGRLPGAGRRAGPRRPRVRPLRRRPGRLQGRDRGAEPAGRADPGRVGAPRLPRARAGHRRARPP